MTRQEAEIQDWAPAGDLRFRLVFYKADFRALIGWPERTLDFKVSSGEFPEPDFYDGRRAAWTRETVYTWLKARKTANAGARRVFGGKA